jgi:hypothetical protein
MAIYIYIAIRKKKKRLLSRYSDLDGGVWSLSQRGAGIRTGTKPLRVSFRTLKPITAVIKPMMKVPGFWYLTVVIKQIRYLVNNMLPWLSIWNKKKKEYNRLPWELPGRCQSVHGTRRFYNRLKYPDPEVLRWQLASSIRTRRFFGSVFIFECDRNRRVLKQSSTRPTRDWNRDQLRRLHKP